ncbi:ABC transporter ATP-binding protein [Candidatus Woesearchaeota archaeon]|jgi:ABC-2 type transport system ATP-binding protein|nr:ABC transporter ATP-binding protein [Candidatus Woesearchaeota archaeon]
MAKKECEEQIEKDSESTKLKSNSNTDIKDSKSKTDSENEKNPKIEQIGTKKEKTSKKLVEKSKKDSKKEKNSENDNNPDNLEIKTEKSTSKHSEKKQKDEKNKDELGIDDQETKEQKKSLIRVTKLTKRFGKKLVLEKTNMEIYDGDIFGIVGMSGSGKTTLLHMLIGFIKTTEGDVEYRTHVKHNGVIKPEYKSVFKFFNQNKIKKLYGYSSQTPSFYEHLTVEENLKLYGRLYKLSGKIIKERITEILNFVDLEADRNSISSELSGGMQKRLDIGCSLIHKPKILFMDEPTADLDPIIRKQMWKLIKKISNEGTTVILSSHLLDEIEHLCTKIGVLHDHRMLGYGTLHELKELFSKNQEIHIHTKPGNYEKLIEKFKKRKLKIKKTEEKDETLILYALNAQKILPKIAEIINDSREKIISLDLKEPTLKEIFEILTKTKKETK